MKTYLSGISYFLPERRVTNADLVARNPAWNAEEIFKRTGIRERRVAEAEQTASDLAVLAAERLFAMSSCAPDRIDGLLFCSQSPDYLSPATACLLQERLKIPTTLAAFDYNLGCSGFPMGLWLARALILSQSASNILLIVADTLTKYCHPLDLVSSAVFSDGAAAVWISNDPNGALAEIGPTIHGTDGRGVSNLFIPAGGARHRCTSTTAVPQEDGTGNLRSLNNIYMNGPEILNFAISAVPEGIRRLLTLTNSTIADTDIFLMHQANAFLLDVIRRKLQLPPEKMPIDMADIGNTAGASLPILLSRLRERGLLKPHMKAILAGFGVGYAWGMTQLTWLETGEA